MLKKIGVLLLLLFTCGYGYEINYRYIKLEITPFYPVKLSIYEREPVFIRFDVQIKKNLTGVKKEILLKNIIIKPADKNVMFYQQESSINPEEKKLTVKNVVYYKKGDTYFPFTVEFDTDKLKGVLSQKLIKALSKSALLKKSQPVYISEVPHNTPYVGNFDIQLELKGEKGLATLVIKIDGKGYPLVPSYRLIVKNGSSRKIAFNIQNDMGYISSIQKFKISYLDWVEVLPVRFRFFDPYQEKLREIETKSLKILPPVRSKTLKPVPQEEKMKKYIQQFQQLYPELFEKKTLLQEIIKNVFLYKYQIIIIFTLFLIVGSLLLKTVLVRLINPYALEVINLNLNSLEDLKKLYKYFSSKSLESYLQLIDSLLFKSEIKSVRGKLLYIKTENKLLTPSNTNKIFENMKKEILKNITQNHTKKEKTATMIYYFLKTKWETIITVFITALLTALIQLFIDRFPQHRAFLLVLNIGVISIASVYIVLINRKIIKVKDDRGYL